MTVVGTFRKYLRPHRTSAFSAKADLVDSTISAECSAAACSRNERLWDVRLSQQLMGRHPEVEVHFLTDCVAKAPKCRATDSPLKNNRQSPIDSALSPSLKSPVSHPRMKESPHDYRSSRPRLGIGPRINTDCQSALLFAGFAFVAFFGGCRYALPVTQRSLQKTYPASVPGHGFLFPSPRYTV
jgi:hypothetical protein